MARSGKARNTSKILGESFKVDVPFAMYNDKIADDQMSMKITSETIPILFSSAFEDNVAIKKINTLIIKLK